MSIDRLPPQSIEAEQSVLGALLIDRDAVIEVAELLRPEDFYRSDHGAIYDAVLQLYERREPVDLVTVSEVLERQGELERVGGVGLPDQPHQPDARPPSTPCTTRASWSARPSCANLIGAAGKIAGIGYDDSADLDGSHRPRRAGAVRGQPEARRERLRAAAHACSTRRTTGSTTCTSTGARSAASAPGSPTSTR